MPKFPKIDRPCPLANSDEHIKNNVCNRCQKTVHDLNQLSNSEQYSLFATAKHSLCVRYPLQLSKWVMATALASSTLLAGAAHGQNLVEEVIIIGGVVDLENIEWIESSVDDGEELVLIDADDFFNNSHEKDAEDKESKDEQ